MLHIEGFGIFQDRPLTFQPGINLIYGPNEAGKSTLLAFIQHILFGFPDGRSRERSYPALRGGRTGGRLFLRDRQGKEYVVERFAGTRGGDLNLRLPDGSQGREADLQELLGQTNREVFCQIFAFGLGELQTFDTLSDQAVQAHIYSAGTGGIPIAEIEGKMAQQADKLFRPSAQNPIVNKLFGHIEQRTRELRELGDLAAEYTDVSERRDALQVEIDRQARDLAVQEGQLKEQQRLVEAWGEWQGLQEVETELGELDEIDDFPEDGTEVLQRLQEKQEEFDQTFEGLQQEIDAEEQLLEPLVVDECLLAQERNIDALGSDRNRYEVDHGELTRAEQELEGAEESLQETLRNLGSDWDEARLQEFDGSIPVGEEIREFKKRLEQKARERHDLERVAEEVGTRLDEVQQDLDQVKKVIKGETTVDEGKLHERRKAARRLEILQGQYGLLEQQKRPGGKSQSPSSSAGKKVLPVWPAYVMMALGGAGGIGLGVEVGALGGIVLGVLLVVVAGFYLWIRKEVGKTDERGAFVGAGSSEQMAVLKREMEEIARLLDMKDFSSGEELERIESLIDEEEQKRSMQITRQERVKELEEQLARRHKEEEGVQGKCKKGVQAFSEAEKEWQAWLGQHGLRETLSPDGALEVLSEVRAAREKFKNVEKLRSRVEKLEDFVRDFGERLEQVCEDCSLEGGGSVLSRVDRLIDDWDETRQIQQKRMAKESLLLERRKELEDTRKRLEKQREEERRLLEMVGAVDREEFVEKGKIYDQRQICLEQQRQHRHNLERLVGVEGKYERALETFREKSAVELEAEAETLGIEVNQLRETADTDREQLGRLKQLIEGLETKEEAAQLRLEQSVALEQLEGQAEEWATWTLCQMLLEETRTFYEQERRPGVIKEADGFFKQMTEGCYTRIVAPLGQQQFLVDDQNGGQRPIEALSRGTAEQLYLSLRMGLIREFGRKAEPLPVIVDDIMVNFDPERARYAAGALEELATDHQVIMMTCHPSTVELMQDGRGDAHLIELDRDAAFGDWVVEPEVQRHGDVGGENGDEEKETLGLRILEVLEEGALGISDLEAKMGEERVKVQAALKLLRGQKRVDTTGAGKGTKWIIAD
jgi:uncharacterized protein YhaN